MEQDEFDEDFDYELDAPHPDEHWERLLEMAEGKETL